MIMSCTWFGLVFCSHSAPAGATVFDQTAPRPPSPAVGAGLAQQPTRVAESAGPVQPPPGPTVMRDQGHQPPGKGPVRLKVAGGCMVGFAAVSGVLRNGLFWERLSSWRPEVLPLSRAANRSR